MPVYNLDAAGKLTQAEDPFAGKALDQALAEAGYLREASSELVNPDGAAIAIYATDSAGVPRFYVDVMGANSTFGGLLANDFGELLAVLRAIHPLTMVIGLDQAADIEAQRVIEKEGVEGGARKQRWRELRG